MTNRNSSEVTFNLSIVCCCCCCCCFLFVVIYSADRNRNLKAFTVLNLKSLPSVIRIWETRLELALLKRISFQSTNVLHADWALCYPLCDGGGMLSRVEGCRWRLLHNTYVVCDFGVHFLFNVLIKHNIYILTLKPLITATADDTLKKYVSFFFFVFFFQIKQGLTFHVNRLLGSLLGRQFTWNVTIKSYFL